MYDNPGTKWQEQLLGRVRVQAKHEQVLERGVRGVPGMGDCLPELSGAADSHEVFFRESFRSLHAKTSAGFDDPGHVAPRTGVGLLAVELERMAFRVAPGRVEVHLPRPEDSTRARPNQPVRGAGAWCWCWCWCVVLVLVRG